MVLFCGCTQPELRAGDHSVGIGDGYRGDGAGRNVGVLPCIGDDDAADARDAPLLVLLNGLAVHHATDVPLPRTRWSGVRAPYRQIDIVLRVVAVFRSRGLRNGCPRLSTNRGRVQSVQ